MWRSLFLAIGVYCCILGGECLLIDKAVLAARQESPATFVRGDQTGRRRELSPSEWAPWSLLSVGAVTILYSFTIPKRVKE